MKEQLSGDGVAESHPRFTVHATADAHLFSSKIAHLIDADPVGTSVVATNLQSVLRDASKFADPWWMWVELEGEPVAAAMHTPPRPPHLATDNPAIGTAIADYLAASGRAVTGVGGFRSAAVAFAERWTELHPVRLSTIMEQGVYEADELTPPSGVPGSLRRSASADAPLLNGWAVSFIEDIRDPVPERDDILTERASRGEMWIWEVNGTPVSMAWASPPSGGVSRISWVYTPRQHRRHGYASAVVAGATAHQREQGNRCLLYTDLANPTSNGIYQAIGYRRVGDAVVFSLNHPQ